MITFIIYLDAVHSVLSEIVKLLFIRVRKKKKKDLLAYPLPDEET